MSGLRVRVRGTLYSIGDRSFSNASVFIDAVYLKK